MEEKLDNTDNSSNFVKTEELKPFPKIDESKLVKNPFSQDLIIKTTKRIDPRAKVKDAEGNEVPAFSVVEKAKSTKVYKSAQYRDMTLALSAGALRMFVYIVYEIDGPKDWIRIYPEQYLQKGVKSSRSSYNRAIEELITEGYISPTMYKHIYWINPMMMFSGSRVGKYPDKVIVENSHTW